MPSPPQIADFIIECIDGLQEFGPELQVSCDEGCESAVNGKDAWMFMLSLGQKAEEVFKVYVVKVAQ